MENNNTANATETLDQLVEVIMDIAREQSIDDAVIIIRDRIEKHYRPLYEAAKAISNVHTWKGSPMYAEAQREAIAELRAALALLNGQATNTPKAVQAGPNR